MTGSSVKILFEQASAPVVLAGSLVVGNVAEAIEIVSPWAVDSFSHANKPNSVRKDPLLVSEFVKKVKCAS